MHKRIRPVLEKIFKGKVVIVGIGNIMRRDDGFGPALINRIKDKTDALCIDAGPVPENYLGSIIKEKPDTILLVDAVHMEKRPGDYDVFRKQDILRGGFTTHNMSPVMIIEYLGKETNADIYMLGIQPQNVFFGDELSARLNRALRELSNIIVKTLKDNMQKSHL